MKNFKIFFLTAIVASLNIQPVRAEDSKVSDIKTVEDAVSRVELNGAHIQQAQKKEQEALELLLSFSRKAIDQQATLSEAQIRRIIKSFIKSVSADRSNELSHLTRELLSKRKKVVTKIIEEEDHDFDLRKALKNQGNS